MSTRTIAYLSVIMVFFLTSCEKQPEPHKKQVKVLPSTSVTMLHEPSEVHLTETVLDALPAWRPFKKDRPVLILFSATPHFAATPAGLVPAARLMADEASPEQFIASMPYSTSDPVVLPEMAIRTAISAGFFSHIIWVAPIAPDKREQLTATSLREHLRNQQFLSSEEATALTESETGFSGKVADIPLSIMFPSTLSFPKEQRYIVHFDLSFFVATYQGEIKTPIYMSIREQLLELKKQCIKTFSTTISQSNLGENLPLKFRGFGADLASLITQPATLEGPIPKAWELRSRIYYLENFFQPKERLNLAEQLVKLDEHNPAALYDLHLALQENDIPSDIPLEKAISLDPLYALEYVSLANKVKNKKLLTIKATLLEKALKKLPYDPIIKLRLAQTLKGSGQKDKAELLFSKLRQMKWSPIYFPNIPTLIAQ